MNNLVNFNGLMSFTEDEILDRQYLKAKIIQGVQNILLECNRGWLFKEIESTSLIPNEFINVEYSQEDYFKIDDKLSLKPETTATSYLYAKYLMTHNSIKPPLCVFQASKSYRKEQDQVVKHMRLKEFYQLEFQGIYSNGTKNDYQSNIIESLAKLVQQVLKLNTRIVLSDRLPSYSLKTIDIEVFNGDKWMEICSVSKRNDFDEDHTVVEIAFGLDRLLYNFTKTNEVFNVSFENLLTS